MPDISILFAAGEERLLTAVGEKLDDRILVRGADEGCALFGPYIQLPSGRFQAAVRFAEGKAPRGDVLLEVCAEGGAEVVGSKRVSLAKAGASRRIGLPFSLSRPASRCEVRLHCLGAVTAEISGLEITYVDRDTSAVEAELAGRPVLPPFEQAVLARFDALERLVRGGQGVYVGNNRILMRTPLGEVNLAYFMPADDRLLTPIDWAYGQHEPDVTSYFRGAVAGASHCLDVGANFGYFTCLMAHLARQGMTIGLEPDPQIYELLRDNVIANSLGDCAAAMQGAASDQSGRMTLYRRETRSGNTSLARAHDDFTRRLGEAPAEPFETDAFAVDDLLPRFRGRIDFMKVDVEGAEPLVFRGMGKTLEANPQIRIVMEWSPAQIVAAGFELDGFLSELDGLGLQAAMLGPTGPVPIPFSALTRDVYHSGVLFTRRPQ